MQTMSKKFLDRMEQAGAIAFAILLAFSSAASANSDMLSNSRIERAGLVSDWFTQLDSGPRSRIVNMVLQVNDDITTRIYQLEYDGRVETISQHDLSPFGVPFGIEGAEAHAEVRKEIIAKELLAQGKEPVVNIRTVTLPKSTIYTSDLGGNVTAIDADSGQRLWSAKVGRRKDLTTGVGASRNHVAVINGATLYVLDAENGKVLWSQQCENGPNAAPSVSDEKVYVPLVNGRLEVFSLEEQGQFSRSFVSFGAAIAQPLVTESTVSWATTSGHYSVASLDGKKVQYQLVANDGFTSGGASDKDTVYVATTNGRVYAFDESRGSIHWEYETGDRVLESPVVVGKSLYVFAAEGRLHRINTFSGRPADGWEKPIEGPRKFVGLSRDRIYVLNRDDELIGIDKNTGTTLSRIPGRLGHVLPNFQSDRLYVGNERGLIQCIREKANHYPIFHADEIESMGAGKPVDKKSDAPESLDAEDDPFAEESDPFAEEAADTDPFATEESGDDPFATEEEESGEDPFAADEGGDDSMPAEAEDDGKDPFATDDDSSADEDEDDPFGDADDSDDSDPFGG